MKKIDLLKLLMLLPVLALMGCPGNQKEVEPLTPIESKSYLQETGIEFMESIKAEDHQNLVDLTYFVGDEFSDFVVDERYVDKVSGIYQESSEASAKAPNANVPASVFELVSLCQEIAQNGQALTTRATEIYTINAGFPDLYGSFTPDYQNNVWTYDASVKDRLEVSFKDNQNQLWVATLKGSEETTLLHIKAESVYEEHWYGDVLYNDHDMYDYKLRVPKEINFDVTCDGVSVIKLVVKSDLALAMDLYESYEYYYDGNQDSSEEEIRLTLDYTNLNLDASLNVNGYETIVKNAVTKKDITASSEIKIAGKSMLRVQSAVAVDIDKLVSNIEDAESVENNVKSISFEADMMGAVQIKADCPNFKLTFNAIENIVEAEENDLDFREFSNRVSELNGTYDIHVYYEGNNTVQASVELEAYERQGAWNDVKYNDYRPILVFAADDSQYQFENYFSESSFSELIDAFEELVNSFYNLVD